MTHQAVGMRAQHSLFVHGQLSVRGGTIVIVKMQMNKIIVLAENF